MYNPYPGVMEGAPASNGYAPGFTCDLMVKDLRLASDVAEPNAWNAQLARLDAWTRLTLLSETRLRVDLPALPTYRTLTPERVKVTIPAIALRARQPLAAGAFVIGAEPGSCELSGSLVDSAYEDTLRTRHDAELVLTLRNDTWSAAVRDGATDLALQAQIAAAMAGSASGAWDTHVQPLLRKVVAADMRGDRLVLIEREVSDDRDALVERVCLGEGA